VVAEARGYLHLSLLARNSPENCWRRRHPPARRAKSAEPESAVEAPVARSMDLVRVDVYITDMTMFDDIHAVRREFFSVDPPASTMVRSSASLTKTR